VTTIKKEKVCTTMNDGLETIKREIAFRNNAIKKIAEME
jgi:hypothetical protein